MDTNAAIRRYRSTTKENQETEYIFVVTFRGFFVFPNLPTLRYSCSLLDLSSEGGLNSSHLWVMDAFEAAVEQQPDIVEYLQKLALRTRQEATGSIPQSKAKTRLKKATTKIISRIKELSMDEKAQRRKAADEEHLRFENQFVANRVPLTQKFLKMRGVGSYHLNSVTKEMADRGVLLGELDGMIEESKRQTKEDAKAGLQRTVTSSMILAGDGGHIRRDRNGQTVVSFMQTIEEDSPGKDKRVSFEDDGQDLIEAMSSTLSPGKSIEESAKDSTEDSIDTETNNNNNEGDEESDEKTESLDDLIKTSIMNEKEARNGAENEEQYLAELEAIEGETEQDRVDRQLQAIYARQAKEQEMSKKMEQSLMEQYLAIGEVDTDTELEDSTLSKLWEIDHEPEFLKKWNEEQEHPKIKRVTSQHAQDSSSSSSSSSSSDDEDEDGETDPTLEDEHSILSMLHSKYGGKNLFVNQGIQPSRQKLPEKNNKLTTLGSMFNLESSDGIIFQGNSDPYDPHKIFFEEKFEMTRDAWTQNVTSLQQFAAQAMDGHLEVEICHHDTKGIPTSYKKRRTYNSYEEYLADQEMRRSRKKEDLAMHLEHWYGTSFVVRERRKKLLMNAGAFGMV